MNTPSFKILGYSWAAFGAVVKKLGLPSDCDLATVQRGLVEKPVTLFTASDGNLGFAIARVGAFLPVRVKIYVPRGMNPSQIRSIENEGATVIEVDGSYDMAVRVAFDEALQQDGILVQDIPFPGFEEIGDVSYTYS